MNRLLKGILAVCAMLSLALTSAMAFDKDMVMAEYIQDMDYDEFLLLTDKSIGSQVSMMFLNAMEESMGDDVNVSDFYMIDSDNIDDDDLEMFSFAEEYLEDEEYILENEVYVLAIFNNLQEDYIDGWIVISHYCEEEDFSHVAWWFAVEAAE